LADDQSKISFEENFQPSSPNEDHDGEAKNIFDSTT